MSATVPMEFSFGSGGNLKAARRLRNLDLKKNRPAVHPLFGNKGSIVGRAYAASGGLKQTAPSAARPASPLSPVGKVGIRPNLTSTLNQGIASEQGTEAGGGQVIPSPRVQNPVVPSTAPQPGSSVPAAPQGGFFSKGSNIVLAGGGLIAVIFLLYMLMGKSKSRRRRRNNNNNKKGRG